MAGYEPGEDEQAECDITGHFVSKIAEDLCDLYEATCRLTSGNA
jgi:hypothetical protein